MTDSMTHLYSYIVHYLIFGDVRNLGRHYQVHLFMCNVTEAMGGGAILDTAFFNESVFLNE